MIIHQPVAHRASDYDSPRREAKKLAENFAIRAREWSDAVAQLGLRIAAGQQFRDNLMKIQRLHVLAEQASDDLLAVVEALETGDADVSTREPERHQTTSLVGMPTCTSKATSTIPEHGLH